ncbi:hypothetical protein MKX01_006271 [Papaver californicum]|nr:hypothetical protein MKX01_006271 [Papaver californicum]
MSSSTVEDLAMDSQVNNVTDSSNVARTKQPAWNKQPISTDAAADTSDFGSVMGDFSWPALSRSAKASPKSSSDGSVSAPQGSGVISSPKLQTNNNANSNSSQNHSFSKREKSVKRGDTAQNNTGNPGQQSGFQDSRKGPHHKNTNFDGGLRGRVGSQPRPVNSNHSQTQQTNWSRRSNYGGRQRDNQEPWSSHHRNQPRVVLRNLVGPPIISNPNPLSNTPAAVPPIATSMPLHVYHVSASMPPEPMRVMPFPPPIMPMFVVPYPHMDLRAQIIKQIDYYFSPENLVKDSFLRSRMDRDGGWVPISLIAGFRKVKELTESIPFILDTLYFSSVVEVKGDKIRKKNDWMKWLLIPSQGAAAGDQLASRMENLGLEDGNTSDTIARSLTATSA